MKPWLLAASIAALPLAAPAQSVSLAGRMGIDYRSGERAWSQTANGAIPIYRVTLSSVRIGEVELANVGAAIVPAPMPGILLGNSALSRFQMRRDNDVMRLTVR